MKNADVISGIRMLSFLKHHRGLLWLLGALLAVAAAYLWWQWMYPVAQFRYKLTVEVMTPDGLRSGSSVIEVRFSSSHPLPNPGRNYSDRVIAGEAVYVDLGQGKNLFVLLGTMEQGRGYRGDWNYTNTATGPYTGRGKGAVGVLGLPELAFTFERSPGEERKIASKLETSGGAAQVLAKDWKRLPTFVTFADLNQPKSVRIVQPDTLESGIGAGYMLQRVLLQVTNEPVTQNIVSILTWLPMKRPLGGWAINDPLIDRLGYESFKMPP